MQIKKLRNCLHLSSYFTIFKNNKVVFICFYKKDSLHSMKTKQKELSLQGFSFKFLSNNKIKRFFGSSFYKSVFNGRTFLIYKKDFEKTDGSSVDFVYKNFSVVFLLYEQFFYMPSIFHYLSKKKSLLTTPTFFSGSSTFLNSSFFYRLHVSINSFKTKLEGRA
jgi:hypothetical protein